MKDVGFGDKNFSFAVYIANKPNMLEYKGLSEVLPFNVGEIEAINQSCGNGWRKVFNVYAKVLYSLEPQFYNFSKFSPTWQLYRDNYLLQPKSKTALLFSPPILNNNLTSSIEFLGAETDKVHIICGKTHANSLIKSGKLNVELEWLDEYFAIDIKNKVIVCPYFDYRQLSNLKIARLAELLVMLKNRK